MLQIEQGFELWAGDVTWLLARNIVMLDFGVPRDDKETDIQDMLARRLLLSNAGDIRKK